MQLPVLGLGAEGFESTQHSSPAATRVAGSVVDERHEAITMTQREPAAGKYFCEQIRHIGERGDFDHLEFALGSDLLDVQIMDV